MPEQKKNYFQFNKGINTESNEINFPDGFSTDERNYELLVDGSRRRRKGLANESGGSAKTVSTISTTQAHTSFVWRNADGLSTENYVVHQIGSVLYFTDDAETISTTYHTDTIDLTLYKVSSGTSDATVANTPCQFAFGRGHLFVVNKYLKPFYVKYNSSGDTFNSSEISLLVRDFDGIEDGVGVDVEPTGTITADHRYNLRNRGWKQGDMDQYLSDKSKHPSKSSLWYYGYKRVADKSVAGSTESEATGVMTWDSDKLDAEAFGNASAPQGSLFLNPFDTTSAVSVSGGGLAVPLSISTTWASGSPSAGGSITVTATGHGRSAGDSITISGHTWTYKESGGDEEYTWSINGDYSVVDNGVTPTAGQAEIINANTLEIAVSSVAGNWASWVSTSQDGQIDGGETITKSDGVALSVGPSAVSFFAGRVWYAGIEAGEWADTIFFSKTAIKPNGYGKCHQVNDPTDWNFNQIRPDDGGTLVIPNLGQVKRLVPLRQGLLVFSDQGVWEIGGGNRGFFTADGYSVRKITEAECSSPFSPIRIDNGAIFTGPKGIFRIGPNQFTGLLEGESISESLIQTLWNSIPTANQNVVQTCYDDALKRVYFLFGDSGDNTNQYANALVLDLRVGAYYKYVFNTSSTDGVLTAFTITDSDSTASNKKIKWQCQTTATAITTCDLDQSDYLDFDGSESPLPYVITGWDNLGDFQQRRQAPIVTVYAKRTETGYTESGNGYAPVNESSNLLTAYWDWTDDSVSGKIGSQNETYRHVRAFTPSGTGDVDGYPVVVTRNKVRGRGRVLQLRFDGAATKDSHILGFTLNYDIQRTK